ncbi:MAG: carbohydrate kinase [Bacteroidales bacterium]|nr:carbohydrate kinase [Bacteroidales bacterium]
MEKSYIVGLGEVLWDVFPDGRKLGGAPGNFAWHVSQFGLDSLAASAVGDDALGREALASFDEKGLSYLIPFVDRPTGTVQVTLDAAGVPSYEICEGVAWDHIPFTEALAQVARNAKAVCWGSLAQRNAVSRASIASFLAATPASCLKVFDINLRQHFYSKDIIETSLRACDILKINDDELVIVSRMFGIEGPASAESLTAEMAEKTCRRLIADYGLKMLVLTCGAVGSYVFSNKEKSYISTPKVTVADTVGAGDSFTAAFIASLLLGKDLKTAHQKAVEVSAYVCTCKGAMPVLPEGMKF